MEHSKLQELMKHNASLESHIDHLETELSYLESLLKQVGFPEGVHSLKIAAEELIEEPSVYPFIKSQGDE